MSKILYCAKSKQRQKGEQTAGVDSLSCTFYKYKYAWFSCPVGGIVRPYPFTSFFFCTAKLAFARLTCKQRPVFLTSKSDFWSKGQSKASAIKSTWIAEPQPFFYKDSARRAQHEKHYSYEKREISHNFHRKNVRFCTFSIGKQNFRGIGGRCLQPLTAGPLMPKSIKQYSHFLRNIISNKSRFYEI